MQNVKPQKFIFFLQDLFCGVVDGENVGLVASVERTVEYIFMDALAFPAPDADDDDGNCPTVKNQLLPGLRSFCSALRGLCHKQKCSLL